MIRQPIYKGKFQFLVFRLNFKLTYNIGYQFFNFYFGFRHLNLPCLYLCDFDDVIAEKYLNGEEISVPELLLGVRKATISLQFTGVIPGSAYKKKGVQRLLDCVVNFLPSPIDVPPM